MEAFSVIEWIVGFFAIAGLAGLALLVAFLWTWVGTLVARAKGVSTSTGALLGGFLWIIGVLIVLALPPGEAKEKNDKEEVEEQIREILEENEDLKKQLRDLLEEKENKTKKEQAS